MEYDKESEILPENIPSNVKITLVRDGNIINVNVGFLDNLPEGLNYNNEISYVKLIYFNNNSEIIGDILGSYIPLDLSSGYFNNKVITDDLVLPDNTEYVKILSRLYLNNNTFFRIDKELSEGDNFVNTYFNSTNS
jgi:hypothetical protein